MKIIYFKDNQVGTVLIYHLKNKLIYPCAESKPTTSYLQSEYLTTELLPTQNPK